ncbi:MAG: hypothetical protein PUH02_02415 [bacterium]|nr:hypothetical protein [bacterium]
MTQIMTLTMIRATALVATRATAQIMVPATILEIAQEMVRITLIQITDHPPEAIV